MQAEFLERIIALMEKTGDRVIFADQATGKAIVMMDLEAYERLHGADSRVVSVNVDLHKEAAPASIATASIRKVAEPPLMAKTLKKKPIVEESTPQDFADLTQEGLLDKINRDISSWKQGQERKRAEELRSAVPKNTVRAPAEDAREAEERFYLEPIQ